ncbi:hypothetical protein SISNIDRAFT_467570 [Sistotremastrum niveocremeum HHB9708]|uniref:Uncharacterized protein n=1 Tax=Sistotremastrum niveocremeum HHB9708 TaxID=1314777 RepID=A0A164SMY8_9AGAM|nr:hypothetical protein SISNIDRAFT_467570 [Sistotremastrum niveocremeum HHB9708]
MAQTKVPKYFRTHGLSRSAYSSAITKRVMTRNQRARRYFEQKAGHIKSNRSTPIHKEPESVSTFELCGRYLGVVFRITSRYCIQFFDKDTLEPITESQQSPVAFQVYKSMITDELGMWAPVWTEATEFESGGTCKVFYTWDRISSMKFVDKKSGKCLKTLSHSVQIEDGGYVAFEFFMASSHQVDYQGGLPPLFLLISLPTSYPMRQF